MRNVRNPRISYLLYRMRRKSVWYTRTAGGHQGPILEVGHPPVKLIPRDQSIRTQVQHTSVQQYFIFKESTDLINLRQRQKTRKQQPTNLPLQRYQNKLFICMFDRNKTNAVIVTSHWHHDGINSRYDDVTTTRGVFVIRHPEGTPVEKLITECGRECGPPFITDRTHLNWSQNESKFPAKQLHGKRGNFYTAELAHPSQISQLPSKGHAFV